MAVFDPKWNPTPNELRLFAALQTVFFGLISLAVYRHTHSWTGPATIMSISAVMAVVGVALPKVIHVVYVVWMGAVFPIGWVVSHLIVAVVYYLVVTPVGLLMKIVGRDTMNRKFDPEAKTYWIKKEGKREAKGYFRQY